MRYYYSHPFIHSRNPRFIANEKEGENLKGYKKTCLISRKHDKSKIFLQELQLCRVIQNSRSPFNVVAQTHQIQICKTTIPFFVYGVASGSSLRTCFCAELNAKRSCRDCGRRTIHFPYS